MKTRIVCDALMAVLGSSQFSHALGAVLQPFSFFALGHSFYFSFCASCIRFLTLFLSVGFLVGFVSLVFASLPIFFLVLVSMSTGQNVIVIPGRDSRNVMGMVGGGREKKEGAKARPSLSRAQGTWCAFFLISQSLTMAKKVQGP